MRSGKPSEVIGTMGLSGNIIVTHEMYARLVQPAPPPALSARCQDGQHGKCHFRICRCFCHEVYP